MALIILGLMIGTNATRAIFITDQVQAEDVQMLAFVNLIFAGAVVCQIKPGITLPLRRFIKSKASKALKMAKRLLPKRSQPDG